MRNISLLCLIFVCLLATQTFAATYTVTTAADTGAGSLRAAIASANGTLDSDIINFAIPPGTAGCTAGTCTITLTSGELAITSAATSGMLTITNPTGAIDSARLLISGNNTSRVFYLNPGALVTISGVTIFKGKGVTSGGGIFNNGGNLTLSNSFVVESSAGSGGGIYNSGTLTLSNSEISYNTVTDRGGGIYNEGTSIQTGNFYLLNSSVSDNIANNDGGGIFNEGNSYLTNSTISYNSAEHGGGLYSFGGLSDLINSTVSSNTANYRGGGIANYSTLNLTSVTVTNNKSNSPSVSPPSAGGIDNFATTNLKNTIVAGNIPADAGSPPDFRGTVAAGSSYNLIGNGQGMTGITNGANGNQVGTSVMPINPRLGRLMYNGESQIVYTGGPTTHSLQYGSPALDQGFSFGLTTDERGFIRPVDLATLPNAIGGDGSDIGAYEARTAPLAPTAATVSVSGQVTTSLGRGISGVNLSLTDSQGNTRTATTTTGGYYRFEDVQVGETYIISASGKRFNFSQSVQVLNVNEETNEVNFIANSEKRLRAF